MYIVAILKLTTDYSPLLVLSLPKGYFRSMQWQSLFSNLRSSDDPGKVANPDQARSSFQRDYDRLIFSSAFRRLQNKTQVFPLPGVVFVHNRLTHSLEVASVGRSLGKIAGDHIAASYKGDENFQEFYRYELPSVIAAACLAHDIGNPPFGHSGEDAIRSFYSDLKGSAAEQINSLEPAQQNDLKKFEGNANAFRTLAHFFQGNELTITTMASIVKYPCNSTEGFNKKTGLIASKKSGYFQTEAGLYERIAEELGIPKTEGFGSVYARHPFVYLTEAADDICYRIMDMEDAHRLKLVTLKEVLDLFLPFFEKQEGGAEKLLVKMGALTDDNKKVQYLRARWIGLMTNEAARVFAENESSILEGNLQKSLLDAVDNRTTALLKEVDAFSVSRIYNARQVLEIELAGFHVIGGLLEEFVSAVLDPQNSKSEKLLQLIPPQFQVNDKDLYVSLQSVTDFIAGMTDLYATDLYRRIKGISISTLMG